MRFFPQEVLFYLEKCCRLRCVGGVSEVPLEVSTTGAPMPLPPPPEGQYGGQNAFLAAAGVGGKTTDKPK